MINGIVSNNNLCLRSAIGGRQRWDIDGLYQNTFLADKLEQNLKCISAIRKITINVQTGRILILFDESQLKGNLGQILLECLNEVFETNLPSRLIESNPGIVSHYPVLQQYRDIRTIVPFPLQNSFISFVRKIDPNIPFPWQATSLTVTQSLSQLVAPLSFGLAISIAVAGAMPFFGALGFQSALSQIGMLSVVAVLFKALEVFATHQANKAWNRYSSRVVQSTRLKTFRHLQHLDMQYVDEKNRSELLTLVVNDTDKIRNCLNSVPQTIIDKTLTLGIATASLLLISPVSFLMAVAPVTVVYFVNRNRYQKVNECFGKVAVVSDELTQAVANNLNGMATVRSLNAESLEITNLSNIGERLIEVTEIANDKNSSVATLTEFGVASGFLLPILRGIFQVYYGKLDFNMFNVQISLLPFVVLTTRGLRNHYECFQSAKSATTRINQIMATPITIIEGDRRLPSDQVVGSIHYKNLSFAYNPERAIFDGIDLEIPAKKSIAIVGRSGCGKSTLIKLLLRFYDKSSGELLLDGIDVDELNIHDLRNAIGLVSQEVFLFNSSIYDNILYGNPQSTREEVIEASKIACAYDFICELPKGFETNVGEYGSKLSGGQRQRIAVARTILKQPPILILDEATSAVDNETEVRIHNSIARVSKERTTVMVTHRLSAIRSVDHIIMVEDGKLVEQGTHDELLKLGGFYASQWMYQTGEDVEKHPEVIDLESSE